MRSPQWISAPVVKGVGLALVLAVMVAMVAVLDAHGSARAPARNPAELAATIFSYDGHDFVRTKTTLMTEDGKSAVNTKLEHDSPAYKALIKKHSFTGDVTVFGHKYDADYAPLTSEDGKLTGALFVAAPE
ncbi:MAG: Cache 3/Cache 2 fusion domain-containing protein [Gemmatimonadales bacterium]